MINSGGLVSAASTMNKDYSLCDNQWHKVKAIVKKNVVSLQVDDGAVVEDSWISDVTTTNTKGPLYLGGTEGTLTFHCLTAMSTFKYPHVNTETFLAWLLKETVIFMLYIYISILGWLWIILYSGFILKLSKWNNLGMKTLHQGVWKTCIPNPQDSMGNVFLLNQFYTFGWTYTVSFLERFYIDYHCMLLK